MTRQSRTAAGDVVDVLQEARRVTVLVRKIATPLLAEHGLTIAGRVLLAHLVAEGAATVPDIARHSLMTRQSTQRLVDDLTAAGLLARRDNPGHRRSVLYAVTAEGRRALATATEVEHKLLAGLLPDLSGSELTDCHAVLAQLSEALIAHFQHDFQP